MNDQRMPTQGSVLGPLLWNIIFDALLAKEFPPGVQTIAFADNVANETKTTMNKAKQGK